MEYVHVEDLDPYITKYLEEQEKKLSPPEIAKLKTTLDDFRDFVSQLADEVESLEMNRDED